MKKITSILAMVSTFAMLFASCQPEGREPETSEDKSLSSPVLSSDIETVIVSELGDDVCLTYSWSEVAPEGKHSSYSIQFALASDQSFSSPVEVKCNGLEKPLSSSLLSNIAKQLGTDIDSGFVLVARIVASVKGYEDSFSNVISVTISKAQYHIKSLYIKGAAIESDPQAFKTVGSTFEWTGHLVKNADFILPCQAGETWPAIVRKATSDEDWSAKLGVSDVDYCAFAVTTSGQYKITVDASNSNAITIAVDLVEADPKLQIKSLYIAGEATVAGWDLEKMEAFTGVDGVFTWEGMLESNKKFRFPIQQDALWPALMISTDGGSLIYAASEQEETIFTVETDGIYKIVVDAKDIDDLSFIISFIEEVHPVKTIYLVGGFDWGWNLSAAECMASEDGIVYTWIGKIYGNSDFKFLLQNDAWAPGYNRDADAEEYWTMTYRASDSDPDKQFQVSETGEYSIVINLKNFTIKVRKLEDLPLVYPVGCISDWGWSLDKIQPMETKDGVTYTIKVQVWADNNFKFLCQNDAWWPAYTRDPNADNYFTVRYNDGSLSDDQFRLDTQGLTSGVYNITLNVETMRLKFDLVE